MKYRGRSLRIVDFPVFSWHDWHTYWSIMASSYSWTSTQLKICLLETNYNNIPPMIPMCTLITLDPKAFRLLLSNLFAQRFVILHVDIDGNAWLDSIQDSAKNIIIVKHRKSILLIDGLFPLFFLARMTRRIRIVFVFFWLS